MTDRDVLKALECCTKKYGCGDCPLGNDNLCMITIHKELLDLINRHQAQLRKEENKNSKLRNERNRLKAEIENLKKSYEIYEESSGLKWAKAEAIKEFTERLKKRKQYNLNYREDVVEIRVIDIDNIVKELTEVKDDDT